MSGSSLRLRTTDCAIPGACSARLPFKSAISDTGTFYDGKTSLTTAPRAGNPTLINSATANNTGTLVDYGSGTNYVSSVSIYDSLGELRQTQTAAEGGDTVVTDNFYDSHGWVWQTNNKYVVAGNPSISARHRRRVGGE